MRIGVIEFLKSSPYRGVAQRLYAQVIIKQYASVMPQAISVWCRELGHEVHYATYYGQQDPRSLLPRDLDLVFIATYTQASVLAYALAKMFRAEGTTTIAGGHHAKSFPEDCQRFFDVVVLECDRTLIREMLRDLPRGQIVSSGRALRELPSVEARMPEIRKAFFYNSRPNSASTVPLLASVGCPYTCDFCVDARSRYSPLPMDRVEADLRFLRERFPRLIVSFHDPNFAIRFDEVLEVMQRVSRGGRRYYVVESSLSVLKNEERLRRLRDSGCLYIAPGIESFANYADKSGLRGIHSAHERLDAVAVQLKTIHEYIPGIQANYMFGLETDAGDEPVELLKEVMIRTPFVWSAVSTPMPFGGSPLYDQLLAAGRILETMPFHFYYEPYLTLKPAHYDPVSYYRRMIAISKHVVSPAMTARRLAMTPGLLRILHGLRTYHTFRLMRAYQAILGRLEKDRAFRRFHEGETDVVPPFYRQTITRDLGAYASLLTEEDLRPVPNRLPVAAVS
ncbi:MAG TPA: radical SAM protein [Thermoanaerobaculia bacterium]|jgi:radical SAM superfamily enzyme YgiQ (UPF0313 family)|nr:radical SAM protein [Thermoanaerobaculia bacterium]